MSTTKVGIKYVPMSIKTMGCIEAEDDVLALIGQIAGECYNSARDTASCIKRALNCIARGHHSPWEHYNLTLNCVMDRGTSHAVVRHRHCAFQQSSTIYQKYKDLLPIVEMPKVDAPTNKPVSKAVDEDLRKDEVYLHMFNLYTQLLNEGIPAHQARDLLPNALATNLIITTNIREYMYIIQRRTGPGDAVRMHEFATLLRAFFAERYPRILAAFDAWYKTHPL